MFFHLLYRHQCCGEADTFRPEGRADKGALRVRKNETL